MSPLTIISLSLEILGFALALVETVWPHKADKIEEFIDRNGGHLFKPVENYVTFQRELSALYRNRPLVAIIIALIILCTIIWTITFYITSQFDDDSSDTTQRDWYVGALWFLISIALMGVVIMLVYVFTVFCLTFVLYGITSVFIYQLDKIAHGRALGAFGLVLAFIGVIFQIIDSIP